MKTRLSRFLTLLCFLTLTVTLFPRAVRAEEAVSYGLEDPDVQEAVSVWDCVYFGNYKQSPDGNGDYTVEPIKWRVLSVNNGEALLLSDALLYYGQYNYMNSAVQWNCSTLRSQLNGYGADVNAPGQASNGGIDYSAAEKNFLSQAFTADEQSAILVKTLSNNEGEDTADKLFLLSAQDVKNTAYGFAADSTAADPARTARLTAYAVKSAENHIDLAYPAGSTYNWWLRNTNNSSQHQAGFTD